jgi:predicted Zn-dependent peptidase
VEERRLCLWLLSDLREHEGPGLAEIALELAPGAEGGEVEERVRTALAELRERPVEEEELQRARRQLLSDWVFEHERVHQQALAIGHAATVFDLDHVERSVRRLLELEPAELLPAARRWLDPAQDAVLGWALPGGRG